MNGIAGYCDAVLGFPAAPYQGTNSVTIRNDRTVIAHPAHNVSLSHGGPEHSLGGIMDQRDMQSGLPSGASPYAPAQPPDTKPTVRRRSAILGSIGGLVLGLVIGAAGHSAPKTSTSNAASVRTTTTVTATTTVTKQAAVPVVAHTSAAPPPAPSTTAAPKPAVVFTTSGNGMKNTASFTTGPEWSVAYTFDCSNAGGTGNFILDLGGDMGDTLANALAAKGADTSYEHDKPGAHYLQVDSECDWTLKVSDD